MHQHKELINNHIALNVFFIKMSDGLNCFIEDNKLYINNRLRNSLIIRERIDYQYSQVNIRQKSKTNNFNTLIPFKILKEHLTNVDHISVIELAAFLKFDSSFLLLNLIYYKQLYPHDSIFKKLHF
ncbi:hypothetical protein [Staphylococcus schweitzeri]|uniref:Uncharacterized protein n=1 Tax=Staphylococcus schweitzeri TaxID=1654388 RepID=A0A077UHF3_9STAP|nr:hypothetical protein [Staphylococcus schweitzeri]CDR26483.1 hypothetical protein ERS140147_00022 [Staphylococcus schweitzeri]